MRSRRALGLWAAGCFAGGVASAALGAGAAPGGVQYNRDIRPILADNCFTCHGPDQHQRKSGLRLDLRPEAVKPAKSGKPAIEPGKPDASELVRRIFTSDEEDQMPPKESRKTLKAAQRDLLRRWVAAGAEYQPHWAYLAPRRAAPPGAGTQNPVDGFILARLREHGVGLSPEAGRRTLLRRLSLDLTGLPPTAAEMDAWLRDTRDGAYERQVDRLLRSPHYGERMAAPWLDLVRYADTVGYHGDQNINVFPYRDYVIDAFNRDKPFDVFTREQLAGDLLPSPTAEQRVATAFNRLNMVTREGGAQPKEYLAKYAADRVRTVAMAWMGSTMGCCECHDHKFDPFTSRDFYAMEAFFADLKQWGVYSDYDYTPNPDLKGWSNDHPFPPEIEVASPYFARRAADLAGKLEAVIAKAVDRVRKEPEARKAFDAWKAEGAAYLRAHPDGWSSTKPSLAVADTNAAVTAEGVVELKDKPKDDKVTLEVALPEGRLSAIRIDLVPRGTNGVTEDGGATTFRAEFALLHAAAEPRSLTVRRAEATLKEPRYRNGAEIPGISEGWRTSFHNPRDPHEGVWNLNAPALAARGDRLRLTVRPGQVRAFRVSTTRFASLEALASGASAGLRAALGGGSAARGAGAKRAAMEAWLLNEDSEPGLRSELTSLHREWLACRAGLAPVVVASSCEPAVVRVLPRGNWQDESGEVVLPSPPAFLPREGLAAGRRLTRVDLANWLTAPGNPLTARVFVNRLWKQFFGNGLAAQVEDLGSQGEPPSHPELLDWLAVEFRESGWDVKHMVRLIVTSSTYRQSSQLRPEMREADPMNRLLSSQNPRRLEAEMVRDTALAISGLLNLEVGGPSAFPYQPAGYYANIQFPDRDYIASLGAEQYRRGVYSHWQRTFLHPMLANFDAPSREECTASRTVSNTPQQALTLLNDPSFVEAARVFGTRLATSAGGDAKRLGEACLQALGRPPRAAEEASLLKFLGEQRSHYREHGDEAFPLLHIGSAPAPAAEGGAETAAWTQVARVILNLHETITRY